ncbi:response regulator transcription factor [Chloroflexota bacterium]
MSTTETPLLLLVYGENDTLILFETICEPSKYRIVTTSTVNAALSLLSSHKIDLVIIDVMTPQFDSFNVLRTIRRYSTIPIFLLAEYNDMTTCVKSLELGADDCIMKPFHKQEIMVRIKAKLRRANINQS